MARRLFLERRTYRQNRLQDAARLLPILGLLLFFAPIFIRGDGAVAGGEAGSQVRGWLVYYFTVWIGLIALTAFVSRALMRAERAVEAPTEAATGAGEGGDAQL